MRSWPSTVPAAAVFPGPKVVVAIAEGEPVSSRNNWPVPNVESFTDLSAPPVITMVPSALIESELIASVCAGRVRGATVGTCQNLRKPSSPMVYAAVLLEFKAIPFTLPL